MNYDKDKLVAELDEIDCFEDEDLNDDQCDYIWNIICDKTSFNKDNAFYGSGASKFVIIPIEADYVVKIPFVTNAHYEDSGYYDAENHTWVDQGLDYLDYEYCNEEYKRYKLAKEFYSGAELFLAKTERIFTGKTINGYVQERVNDFYSWCSENDIDSYGFEDEDYEKVENSYKSYSNTIVEVLDNFHNIPAVWFDQLFKYAIENDKMKEVEQFFDFLMDEDINDLCARNIGFIGDKPVLMDYAGWYE